MSVDRNKVQHVLGIVDKMLEKADAKSSRYNILLFIKSYSFYLMDKNEESLHICNRLIEHSYQVNYNKSIVCQAYNLKTMIYMRNSQFSNMYDSISRSLSVDENNAETLQLFNMFKEKLVC
ncbi:MAG: hypothetical protein HC830_04020 [Bacteroidetes bacterium]|nr:hypothetical protein [Bacteroidales bacterium]NJO68542.1 hypothetical protein [Bacteroidota bacterium]